ncbi:hypothetical protein C4F40_11620 [Sphingobacterium sp. Ka21]|uniref:DoxX family protein n=1 Tax=Sphingobacterium pedocola TaxID=2082722 RepID=A0ABR9T9Q5_9SPHI|nr:hypothetical protein [Sphingobacterium pedocola]
MIIRKYKSVSIIIRLIVAFAFGSELLRRKVGSFAGLYPFAEKWKIDTPINSSIIYLKSLVSTKIIKIVL